MGKQNGSRCLFYHRDVVVRNRRCEEGLHHCEDTWPVVYSVVPPDFKGPRQSTGEIRRAVLLFARYV